MTETCDTGISYNRHETSGPTSGPTFYCCLLSGEARGPFNQAYNYRVIQSTVIQ